MGNRRLLVRRRQASNSLLEPWVFTLMLYVRVAAIALFIVNGVGTVITVYKPGALWVLFAIITAVSGWVALLVTRLFTRDEAADLDGGVAALFFAGICILSFIMVGWTVWNWLLLFVEVKAGA